MSVMSYYDKSQNNLPFYVTQNKVILYADINRRRMVEMYTCKQKFLKTLIRYDFIIDIVFDIYAIL